MSLFFGWAIGFVVAIAAAIGKEARDYYTHGKPDHWDAIATGLGGVAGAALYGLAYLTI